MKTKTFNYYLQTFTIEQRLAAFKYWKGNKQRLNFFGFTVEYKRQFENK